MFEELDDLVAAVKENTSMDDSIIQTLEGIAAQLENLPAEKEVMVQLAEQLRAKSAAIAAAIQNVTPPVEPPVE